MFDWIAKKFLGSELNRDLQGLRSLPSLVRAKTAILIYERIQNGLNFLTQGTPLIEIQTSFQEIRRKAVAQASGYSDPMHLVGSLPDLFFGSLSDSYGEHDRVSVCRSISDALKTIIQQDAAELLGTKKAQEVGEAYSSFQRRLVEHKFI